MNHSTERGRGNIPPSLLLLEAVMSHRHSEVLIVVPPFALPAFPALGPSLLSSACKSRGLSCNVFYPSLELAALLGDPLYRKLSLAHSPFLVGEALFAPYAFDVDRQKLLSRLFRDTRIDKSFGESRDYPVSLQDYQTTELVIEKFLSWSVGQIVDRAPSVLGLSTIFHQNSAAIAIARRVKAERPDLVTVLGGGNVTQPMGGALLEIAPAVDFAFSGEADFAFPSFCENFLRQGELPPERIIMCPPVTDLETVTIPDYGDYFEQLRVFQAAGRLPTTWPEWIHFESSRGCWWGSKCHCAFCGLNTTALEYRRKSGRRVVREVQELVNRHNHKRLHAVDNVMPKDFERDVLLDKDLQSLGVQIYYEVRASLPIPVLDACVRAGVVMLQAGIESLSSHVLKCIRKGTTALQNLMFLREAASRQIQVSWGLMVDIPGEREDDYREILRLLPMIEHLQPPVGWGPVRVDRFSPYFIAPSAFGISSIDPFPIYAYICPSHARVRDLAYHFHGDYESVLRSNRNLCMRLDAALSEWTEGWSSDDPPHLSLIHLPNGNSLIHDTRSCARHHFTALDRATMSFLETLEAPVREEAVPEGSRVSLRRLVDDRFVLRVDGCYLSLVTMPSLGIDLRKAVTRLDYPPRDD
jgi:ribosomal peptide maturation radical SAM protein 1